MLRKATAYRMISVSFVNSGITHGTLKKECIDAIKTIRYSSSKETSKKFGHFPQMMLKLEDL